jgi:hypothetical protein
MSISQRSTTQVLGSPIALQLHLPWTYTPQPFRERGLVASGSKCIARQIYISEVSVPVETKQVHCHTYAQDSKIVPRGVVPVIKLVGVRDSIVRCFISIGKS